MTTKAWSHLPNAAHIDWALKTLKKNPEMWMIVWNPVWDTARCIGWDAAETAAQNASFGSLRSASWRAVSDAMLDAMLDAVSDAVWDAVWDAANGDAKWVMRGDVWRVVSGAIAALIAWDESGELLDMPVEEVIELAREGNHAAVLLLPAVIVKNKLKEKNI